MKARNALSFSFNDDINLASVGVPTDQSYKIKQKIETLDILSQNGLGNDVTSFEATISELSKADK